MFQREFELRISTAFHIPPALVAKLCSDIVDSYVALEEEQLKRQQVMFLYMTDLEINYYYYYRSLTGPILVS